MSQKPSDLKQKASQLSPILNIGKSGITDSLVDELKIQLKRNKLVKIKILRTALKDTDRRTIAGELSRRTGSRLIDVRGSSAILYFK